MVTSRTKHLSARAQRPRFIYLAGCDGTGKSTQSKRLLAALREEGLEPEHLWLRFPFFLSLPLLAYARWRGYSSSEEHDGVRYGYWNFGGSPLLRALLPWLLLLDAAGAALWHIYLPLLRGRTLVCERFALDMLADLSVAFGDDRLHLRLPGRLFRLLIPRDAAVAVLDLDAATIRERRPDLRLDRKLEQRLSAFRAIASDFRVATVSSAPAADAVERCLLTMIGGDDGR